MKRLSGVEVAGLGSMRKVTMVLVSWLAAKSQVPERSMVKLRGVWPWVASLHRLARRPVA